MGSCSDCPNRNGSSHVCAMRFWGLRKVIERHLYDPTTAPIANVVTAETPSPELERITRPKVRAFASSLRAQRFPGGANAINGLWRS